MPKTSGSISNVYSQYVLRAQGRLWHLRESGNTSKGVAVSPGNAPLVGDEFLERFELCQTECRLKVCQTIVEANRPMNVFDRIVLGLCREILGSIRPRGSIGEIIPPPPVVMILLPLKL